MTKRATANKKIVQKLAEIVEKYPDLRFSQILQNFGFVEVKEITELVRNGQEHISLVWEDEFYLESSDLLRRVNERSND